MATQPPITSFFGSKKRRAPDSLERNAKLMKGDPTLLKVSLINTSVEVSKPTVVPRKVPKHTTPRKTGCDIRSYMTSKSPYRPECPSNTAVKIFRNETTPLKSTGSIMKNQINNRPLSAVKKSIHFEDEEPKDVTAEEPAANSEVATEVEDTDDIIKAANDLVEKMKSKSQTLSDVGKTELKKKSEVMTAGQLKKKLARSAKLAQLKSSLSKLGEHAGELIRLEKQKKESEEPKITKFNAIEIDVPRSPHKGALASPAKPAYERFAHLVHRTAPTSAPSQALPLPMGFQQLLDFFTATDTVCSMMLNRGELITFKKVKPAVQELTRKTLTERHLAQMATVLPQAFSFRQEKIRNFGSTSKIDRYELVLTPCVDILSSVSQASPPADTTNLVRAAERKKMTPRLQLLRKEAFHNALLARAMEKHEEFLSGLDPPLNVQRGLLTRWHPNFPVDLVPDVPPAQLPEPPTKVQAPTSARDVLDRAKQLLNSNTRMRNALEAASRSASETDLSQEVEEGESGAKNVDQGGKELDPEVKAAVDKRVASHDPLKGISKSLLDKIRAKQAAKALETMKMSPAEEQELILLTQLPDSARIVRTLYVDNQKSVLPLEMVLEKIIFSSKRSISKVEVEGILRRLITELPDWLSLFFIKSTEYLKLNRAMPFGPIMEKLDKMESEKRRALS